MLSTAPAAMARRSNAAALVMSDWLIAPSWLGYYLVSDRD
jgi:hypothetical protein